MGTLVSEYVWKRRTHNGVTAAMLEPSFWNEGDENGSLAVAPVLATELAARATAEYERARTPPPAPAAKKTVKHKLTKHHEEETSIVDDDPDDDEDDRDDEDPDEEDEEEARAVDTAPVRAALAAKGRGDAARSEDRRIRSLRAQRSLEQQSEAERHAMRVIAAAAGHTGEPRFASLEDIERARQPAPVGRRGGRIIDGRYVVGE